MISSITERFKENDNKVLTFIVFPLIFIVFILLHTNQKSSQSMASLLLMLSPLCFFYMGSKKVFEYKRLRILFALITFYTLYNFLILTQYSFNQLSLVTYRALFFWLTLPFILMFLFSTKPSLQSIVLLFSLAAIFSIYPVFNDYIHNQRRGFSSGHPIFWGNISLCSAMIAFSLRKSFSNKCLQVFCYIGLVCGLTASLWSLTRGGWISIPLSIVCLYLCNSITKRHIAALSILLMSVVLFVPSVYERINYTLQSIDFSEQSSSIKIDPSIQARLDMWKTATTFIKESPIKGNGFSGYRDGIKTLIADGKDVGHIGSFNMPHNEYVHLLVSGGLISLTLLLLILVTLIKIFSSFQPNSSFKVAGYLLVIQFLVFSISEIFFSTKLTIIYFCIASALIIYAGLNEDQKHDH
jgi:O-antigen ligase